MTLPMHQQQIAAINARHARAEERLLRLMYWHSAGYALGDRGHLAHNWTRAKSDGSAVLSGAAHQHATRVIRLQRLRWRLGAARSRMTMRVLDQWR